MESAEVLNAFDSINRAHERREDPTVVLNTQGSRVGEEGSRVGKEGESEDSEDSTYEEESEDSEDATYEEESDESEDIYAVMLKHEMVVDVSPFSVLYWIYSAHTSYCQSCTSFFKAKAFKITSSSCCKSSFKEAVQSR